MTGELCIAGYGVGVGYLNHPELTSEKFIPNLFGEDRLYKTGDLAYWREDDNIVYVGRNDFQVKIRGLWIELGEIESVVSSFDGIGLTAVADRRDESVRQYLVGYYIKEYPAIAQRAQEENAVIYWDDETGISNCENCERGFSPKGHPPVLPVETKKERLYMISALTAQGRVCFMLYEGSMNQQWLIAFVRSLIRISEKKVFLIIDNLKVHYGKKVSAWLEQHREQLELFFLPPYASESNPDEYLNHVLKLSVHSGTLPRARDDIRHFAQSFMRSLQRNNPYVSAFFWHKLLSYICIQKRC